MIRSMSVAVTATCACLFLAGAAFARGSGLQFMNFRYLGVSSAQHGLSMELRTQTGTANATVRLHTDGSKRILASYHVGVVSHTWHRFVLREHGTDFFFQLGIVEHEELGLDERPVLSRDQRLHLRGCPFQGGDEPGELGVDLRSGNVVTGNGNLLVQEQECLPAGHAGGRADSRELHHAA